ncbi:hypothetical protein PG22506_1226 [Bifidobacterium pseudolongum subsp. globosum]|nr:hypothetical protein PG22506_1226 [Bifidobacterium pseudolongum subsp. globosum]
MRGKQRTRLRTVHDRRIIPAHAGQTRCGSTRRRCKQDHPRACGANLRALTGWSGCQGSSPRMRGKPDPFTEAIRFLRIIPAHAGQTNTFVFSLPACTDHPRACGANPAWMIGVFGPFGSSPRMRGKPSDRSYHRLHHRIIPAHAGQTYAATSPTLASADHPRACGANSVIVCCFVSKYGSSPRMRGKLASMVRRRSTMRIIPAHAGQTHQSAITSPRFADHPRACGANTDAEELCEDADGSSPRMRGKQLPSWNVNMPLGIIPAHAGQTHMEYS